jgi:glycosyltransferase involved in cell wall biosynthesis
VVAGERCVDPWKVWHELTLDRHYARHTDVLVTNSRGVVDFYAGHGLPADKFQVIPNGMEIPSDEQMEHALQHGTGQRAALLDQLGLPEGVQLIGAAGRLWPQKRYKDLIWAAELLKVIRQDSHLLIMGEGPQEMELLRWRDNLKIADRVHFLGHRDDVPTILPHLAVFWNGSAYEGQANAVMEAMSWGVPVVASDIAGNRDLVVDGQTGYFFPVGDRATLARITNQLLDDPRRARSLGNAGRERIREHFSVQQMIDRHVALYRRLLEI